METITAADMLQGYRPETVQLHAETVRVMLKTARHLDSRRRLVTIPSYTRFARRVLRVRHSRRTVLR
jgi:hypothetical protein